MQSMEGTPWDVPVPRNVIFIIKLDMRQSLPVCPLYAALYLFPFKVGGVNDPDGVLIAVVAPVIDKESRCVLHAVFLALISG